MAKKTAKKTGRKRTPSRKTGAGRRKAGGRAAAGRRKGAAKRKTGRRAAGARKAKRRGTRKTGARARAASRTRRAAARSRKTSGAPSRKKSAKKSARRAGASRRPRRGGTGRERDLAQTPAAGRTVAGRTNPMRTRRSTGTPAGAGSTRKAPGLARSRRQLREIEEGIPTPPSSLDMDRHASAARTGRAEMREARDEHHETSPVLTGGDVDADWQDAYAVGDEAPGGDNPTPDQDRVEDIGRALGVQYQDNEELRASDKIKDRDRHRWELDPASSEDYRDRD